MSSAQAPVESTAPVPKPEIPSKEAKAAAQPSSRWQKYGTPLFVVLLALAVLITVTWKWNSWEGSKAEQVTDDAYVRGDLTPLSTKVAGIVRSVDVSDYQPVHKGDLLVELEDNDYQAQVAQASAAVEAARAAIEDNLRQEQLQGAKIDRALAGVEQAKAGILAAQAHIDAPKAAWTHAARAPAAEALFSTGSATKQKVEQAVADEEGSQAQLTSGEASLQESKAAQASSESAVEAERRGLLVLKSQEAQLGCRPARQRSKPGSSAGESWLCDFCACRWERGRTASPARPVGLSRNAGHTVRRSRAMGAGKYKRHSSRM